MEPKQLEKEDVKAFFTEEQIEQLKAACEWYLKNLKLNVDFKINDEAMLLMHGNKLVNEYMMDRFNDGREYTFPDWLFRRAFKGVLE